MQNNIEFPAHDWRYQALANRIRDDIARGILTPGQKLPSIRECAKEENLSTGTVKHAYTELASEGLIEIKHGSGCVVTTSIKQQPVQKHGTMALIDKTIDTLLQSGYSLNEIRIFLDLKLKARTEFSRGLSIGIIDCNLETRRMLSTQIAAFSDVETFDFDLDTIRENPRLLPESLDLVLTTTTHFEKIRSVLSVDFKILPLVLTPTSETLIALTQLPDNAQARIIAFSPVFAAIMTRVSHQYKPNIKIETWIPFGELSKQDGKPEWVIMPANFKTFWTSADQEWLTHFTENGGKQILFEYIMDQGSALFAETKLSSLRQKKYPLPSESIPS